MAHLHAIAKCMASAAISGVGTSRSGGSHALADGLFIDGRSGRRDGRSREEFLGSEGTIEPGQVREARRDSPRKQGLSDPSLLPHLQEWTTGGRPLRQVGRPVWALAAARRPRADWRAGNGVRLSADNIHPTIRAPCRDRGRIAPSLHLDVVYSCPAGHHEHRGISLFDRGA